MSEPLKSWILELSEQSSGKRVYDQIVLSDTTSSGGGPKYKMPIFKGAHRSFIVSKLTSSDLELIKANGEIRRAIENVKFEVEYDPGISAAGAVGNEHNWGYFSVGADLFHQHGINGRGVRVAVLDSGIDVSHPSLEKINLVQFRSFSLDTGDYSEPPAFDTQWHGTHVCSILAGLNDGFDRGLAPECELYVGQVLEGWGGSVASIKSGLSWLATEVRPDIVNLSVGWAGMHDDWAPEIKDLTDQGTLVVVAAGNEYHRSKKRHRSPANYPLPGVISVGATHESNEVWHKSGGGQDAWPSDSEFEDESISVPLVSAPGADVVSAGSGGDLYRMESGTSMAAPHVSGLAACMLSMQPMELHDLVDQIYSLTIDELPLGQDERFGVGRIDRNKVEELVRDYIQGK